MQMVKKVLLSIVIILFSTIIFMPKRELYYRLEEQLLSNVIIINNEKIDSSLFGLTLTSLELYMKGIKIADIDRVEIFSLLFYNTISAKGIESDSSLYKILPTKVNSIDAKYIVTNPMSVAMDLNGTFGYAKGFISFSDQKMHFDITEERSINALRSMLTKGDKGWYYETSF